MAENQNPIPSDKPVDFDDLMNFDSDDEVDALLASTETPAADEPAPFVEPAEEIAEPSVALGGSPAEDPEDARIRELKEALSAPLPAAPSDMDVPLTPKQLEIQELEDQLAKRNAIAVESAPMQYSTTTGSGEVILLHVVLDGFTALGEVWYRGQEMEFEVGGPAYRATQDINGNSWVHLATDLEAQYQRWGKQYLAPGRFIPRPNEKFDDEVARQDARRKRAVPLTRAIR